LRVGGVGDARSRASSPGEKVRRLSTPKSLARRPAAMVIHVSPRAARTTTKASVNGRAAQPKPRTSKQLADPDELLGYYRQMLLIRRFEEKTAEMYQRAK